MADCSGLSCRSGKVSKEDAKLWCTSLKAVLSSTEGSNEFIDFLEGCCLYDEVNAVKFWRKCNEIIGECQKLKSPESASGSHNSLAMAALTSNASDVISEYCDNSLVNLHEEMKCELRKSVESRKLHDILLSFVNAKGTAHNLLKDIHSDFAEDLMNKYGLVKS